MLAPEVQQAVDDLVETRVGIEVQKWKCKVAVQEVRINFWFTMFVAAAVALVALALKMLMSL